jgi:hypothetical protein
VAITGPGTDVEVVRERVRLAGIAVSRELDDAWYRAGESLIGQRQFLVPDPDGYLLRFCQVLGVRAVDG